MTHTADTQDASAPVGPGATDGDGQVPDGEVVRQIRHRVAARLQNTPSETADEQKHMVHSEISAWVAERFVTGAAPYSQQYERRIADAVLAALSGLGGLQPLLDRDDVENVHIHGHNRVFLELADGRITRWPHPVAETDGELLELLGDMFARLGQTSREFSPAQPIGNLRLPAGGPLGARLAAVRDLAGRPRVAIRRHRLAEHTLTDLAQRGTVDTAVGQFLSAAVRAGVNLVVSGGPAAGKTFLLRALCAEIDDSEHVVTVEDDYELGLHLDEVRHPLVTPLEARYANAEGVGEITLDDLLKQALRHSPHRLIVGEVRGGEVTALLRALGNGAVAGGMCTLHATSASAVTDRIAALSQLATPPLAIAAAHQWTASALDLIVHIARRDTRTGGQWRRERYVTEIIEVGAVGDADRPDAITVFGPRPGDDRAVPVCPPSPPLLARLEAAGLHRSLFNQPAGHWDTYREAS